MKFINYTNKGWGEGSFIVELNDDEASRIIPRADLEKIKQGILSIGAEVSLRPTFDENSANAQKAYALEKIFQAINDGKSLLNQPENGEDAK